MGGGFLVGGRVGGRNANNSLLKVGRSDFHQAKMDGFL